MQKIYQKTRKTEDAREILTFSQLDEAEVLKDFVRGFYQRELICEIGVINSEIKSRVREVLAIEKDIALGLEKLLKEIDS